MASLHFNNNTCKMVDVWYDSHKNLIIAVCDELDCMDKAQELFDKLLTKQPTLKKLKDEGKPKRAKSGWLYFCGEKRSELMEQYPDKDMGEISKELGKLWQQLEESDKGPYEDQSEQDKQRYYSEKEDYDENMMQFS